MRGEVRVFFSLVVTVGRNGRGAKWSTIGAKWSWGEMVDHFAQRGAKWYCLFAPSGAKWGEMTGAKWHWGEMTSNHINEPYVF